MKVSAEGLAEDSEKPADSNNRSDEDFVQMKCVDEMEGDYCDDPEVSDEVCDRDEREAVEPRSRPSGDLLSGGSFTLRLIPVKNRRRPRPASSGTKAQTAIDIAAPTDVNRKARTMGPKVCPAGAPDSCIPM